MKTKVNQRVGCIHDYNIRTGRLVLFGYGKYLGREIPADESVTIQGISLKLAGVPNPCFLLDSGEKIYGCECRWSDEEHIKQYERVAKKVEFITVESYRRSKTSFHLNQN